MNRFTQIGENRISIVEDHDPYPRDSTPSEVRNRSLALTGSGVFGNEAQRELYAQISNETRREAAEAHTVHEAGRAFEARRSANAAEAARYAGVRRNLEAAARFCISPSVLELPDDIRARFQGHARRIDRLQAAETDLREGERRERQRGDWLWR